MFIELKNLNKGLNGLEAIGAMYSKALATDIIKEQPAHLTFFHSLFGWLTLLAAFKFWLDYEGSDTRKPRQVLINGTVYPLEQIRIVQRGKNSSILVNGYKLTRSKVHIAGVIYEIDGKLVLDTNGDYYTTLDISPEYIVTENQ